MLSALVATPQVKQQLTIAMMLSLAIHSVLVFALQFKVPPVPEADPVQHLKVVLVNSKSASRPLEADALAQNNLDGGGNTTQELQATTALPAVTDDTEITEVQELSRKVATLEAEAQRKLTRVKSDYSIPQPKPDVTPPPEPQPQTTEEPVQDIQELLAKSREIARLEAQIDQNTQAYQRIPRRTFIGARTREYRFSQYVEDWRIKVERIGNLNYPPQARARKLYGKLVLSVSIMADGTLEDVEVSKSSGHPILDASAVRIVRMGGPYTPLPPSITRDTDILTITRTWTFTSSDRLEGE